MDLFGLILLYFQNIFLSILKTTKLSRCSTEYICEFKENLKLPNPGNV